MNTASLKQDYQERIVPILMKEFNYTTVMQCPKLQKIVLNQGLGEAVADKKIIEVALQEMTAIAGQKAVATVSKKDRSERHQPGEGIHAHLRHHRTRAHQAGRHRQGRLRPFDQARARHPGEVHRRRRGHR